MPVTAKNFDQPDDKVSFPNGGGTLVEVGGVTVGLGQLQPGWRWSNDIKPLAKTDSCVVPHCGTVLRGQLHVEMDDGTSCDLRAGDVYVIPPGHDAWVVGDETCEMLDWSGHLDELVAGIR